MGKMSRIIPGSRFGFGGDSGAEPGGRISLGKYPGIMEMLSSLLPTENSAPEATDTAGLTERVFPALELIGEKVPFARNVDDELLRGLALHQLKSPVWGVREHAARVYASLLNRSEILQDVQGLLAADAGLKSQNYLHGRALCVRFALRRYACVAHLEWNGMFF